MLQPVDLGAIDLAHQTRLAPMTDWEKSLGDALEAVFATGVGDLPGIVAALNQARMFDHSGQPWTETGFRAAMAWLGR